MFELRPVETKKDWNTFIDLPWKIYQGDAFWVAPLKLAVKSLLDFKKNPFYEHAILKGFLVWKGSKPVGRIAAIVDENHNKKTGEKTGFFGFFECIDNQEVADLLLNAALNFLKEQSMSTMRGPVNPSTNHECGLLIEGFENPPCVLMTYNPPYYQKLLENFGLKKSKDLLAYEIYHDSKYSDRLLKVLDRAKKRARVQFRSIDMKKFDQEVDTLMDIYNDAWEDNWGFVPMTRAELKAMAKELKPLVDPDLVLVVEKEGEPVGIGLAIPDVNQVLRKIPSGKLFPFGIFKLLWNLKGPGAKKVLNRLRIVMLGFKKEYKDKGWGPLLYQEYMTRGVERGFYTGEASWILEDNIPMNRAMEQADAKKTKTYRIFDRPIS